MDSLNKIGVRIINKANGAGYVKLLERLAFSFVIIECTDISESIAILKTLPRNTNIIAHLDKRTKFRYLNREKDMVASYALLYDFVDAFLISGYDELSDDIDQLINLRMYNDEYRPILMEIPDNMTLDELDNVLSYAKLSSIDGLSVSNGRLLKYAVGKSEGVLTIIADGVTNYDQAKASLDAGANLISVITGRYPYISIFKGRRIIKKLRKSGVEDA